MYPPRTILSSNNDDDKFTRLFMAFHHRHLGALLKWHVFTCNFKLFSLAFIHFPTIFLYTDLPNERFSHAALLRFRAVQSQFDLDVASAAPKPQPWLLLRPGNVPVLCSAARRRKMTPVAVFSIKRFMQMQAARTSANATRRLGASEPSATERF